MECRKWGLIPSSFCQHWRLHKWRWSCSFCCSRHKFSCCSQFKFSHRKHDLDCVFMSVLLGLRKPNHSSKYLLRCIVWSCPNLYIPRVLGLLGERSLVCQLASRHARKNFNQWTLSQSQFFPYFSRLKRWTNHNIFYLSLWWRCLYSHSQWPVQLTYLWRHRININYLCWCATCRRWYTYMDQTWTSRNRLDHELDS